MNEHGQPIGVPVPGWTGCPVPGRVPLDGRYVRLEPVAASHVPALFATLCAESDESLWTYRHDERPTDQAALAAAVDSWATRTPDVTFAIVPRETGRPRGSRPCADRPAPGLR